MCVELAGVNTASRKHPKVGARDDYAAHRAAAAITAPPEMAMSPVSKRSPDVVCEPMPSLHIAYDDSNEGDSDFDQKGVFLCGLVPKGSLMASQKLRRLSQNPNADDPSCTEEDASVVAEGILVHILERGLPVRTTTPLPKIKENALSFPLSTQHDEGTRARAPRRKTLNKTAT